MRADAPSANTVAMNDTEKREEDLMNSTSPFFIETACVTGISPLGVAMAEQLSRARRTSGRRPAPVGSDADERFAEELLATFSDRWEW
jgi:hypothetical protein